MYRDHQEDRAVTAADAQPTYRIYLEAVVDARTFEVTKYLLVGRRVWNLVLSPDESRLYTTNGVSNDVSIIDVHRMKVLKSVAVGRLPWRIAVRP